MYNLTTKIIKNYSLYSINELTLLNNGFQIFFNKFENLLKFLIYIKKSYEFINNINLLDIYVIDYPEKERLLQKLLQEIDEMQLFNSVCRLSNAKQNQNSF